MRSVACMWQEATPGARRSPVGRAFFPTRFHAMHTSYGTKSVVNSQTRGSETYSGSTDTPLAAQDWYCVWTRSHCEQLVNDQLVALGVETFLPKAMMWCRRGGRRTLAEQMLFPGYLFVRHAMDKSTQIDILKTRGVVRLLGERWDRLSRIPEQEVSAVRRMVTAGSRPRRQNVMAQGTPVRITTGPLEGLRGFFISERADKGLFLVSVSLLQRSVAVECDAHQVEPV